MLTKDALYTKACNEPLREGLWLKALTDANHDELRARSLYTKYLVAQLRAESLTPLDKQARSDIWKSAAWIIGIGVTLYFQLWWIPLVPFILIARLLGWWHPS